MDILISTFQMAVCLSPNISPSIMAPAWSRILKGGMSTFDVSYIIKYKATVTIGEALSANFFPAL